MNVTEKMRESYQKRLVDRVMKKYSEELADHEICWLYGVSGDANTELNFGRLFKWKEFNGQTFPPQYEAFLTALEISIATGKKPICIFSRPHDNIYALVTDDGSIDVRVPAFRTQVSSHIIIIITLEDYIASLV